MKTSRQPEQTKTPKMDHESNRQSGQGREDTTGQVSNQDRRDADRNPSIQDPQQRGGTQPGGRR